MKKITALKINEISKSELTKYDLKTVAGGQDCSSCDCIEGWLAYLQMNFWAQQSYSGCICQCSCPTEEHTVHDYEFGDWSGLYN